MVRGGLFLVPLVAATGTALTSEIALKTKNNGRTPRTLYELCRSRTRKRYESKQCDLRCTQEENRVGRRGRPFRLTAARPGPPRRRQRQQRRRPAPRPHLDSHWQAKRPQIPQRPASAAASTAGSRPAQRVSLPARARACVCVCVCTCV